MPGMDIFVTNAARLGLDQDLKLELLSYSSQMMPHVAEGHDGVFTPYQNRDRGRNIRAWQVGRYQLNDLFNSLSTGTKKH